MVAMLRMITESSPIILFASLFYHLLRLIPLVESPVSKFAASAAISVTEIDRRSISKGWKQDFWKCQGFFCASEPEIDWIQLPSAHKRYGTRVAHFTAPPGDLVRIFMSFLLKAFLQCCSVLIRTFYMRVAAKMRVNIFSVGMLVGSYVF